MKIDGKGGGSSLGQTARAVFWSFFGVRKRADYESDVQQLDPRHVLVAGIIGAALFVLALVLLVNWVVGSGVAS
jgi:preprotein translocase subunit Sec61beta